MIIYCTICCRKKNSSNQTLKAIERYQSVRIEKIYYKSISDKVQFRILSGKFGFLKPAHRIPLYNEKLLSENIRNLLKIVETQVNKENISDIVFFSKNPQLNPGWKPYFELMKKLCLKKEINLKVKYL